MKLDKYPRSASIARTSKIKSLDALVTNKDIQKLALRIMLVSEWADQYKQDASMSFEDSTLKIDNMFIKEQKTLDGLYGRAANTVKNTIKTAESKLFDTQGLALGQAELQSAVFEKYQKADTAEQLVMLKGNENTARILMNLVNNGLLPESAKDTMNKAHTPEAYGERVNAYRDIQELDALSGEFSKLKNLEWNKEAADKIRKTQYTPVEEV